MSIRLGQSACSDNEEDDRVRSVNSVPQSDASFEGKRNGRYFMSASIIPLCSHNILVSVANRRSSRLRLRKQGRNEEESFAQKKDWLWST